jgi:membrane-associated phospholipid phosphatase
MATAIAAALWDDYKPARPYLAAFVFFVGFFCVYTGGHYPSDVAAGFIVGLATGRAMNFVKKEYLKKY